MQKTAEKREPGPELLRIAAMFLIIVHHFSCHGGFGFVEVIINDNILDVLIMGGKIGVNAFVLITGYYSIKSKIKAKKAVKLILETVFYSVLTFLIACLFKTTNFRKKYLFFSLIPFFSEYDYWFVTTYILLYFCIPIINMGIQSLTQRQYLGILGLFFFVWSFISHIVSWNLPDYGFSNLGWFIFMYCLGGYLRLYPVKLYKKESLANILLLSSVIVMVCSKVISNLWNYSALNPIIVKTLKYLLNLFSDYSMQSPMSVLISVLMLISFQTVKIKPRSWIYSFSSATFGVYLIHDSNWTRELIWNKIFNVTSMAGSKYFLPFAIAVCFTILVVCSVIDIVRQNLIEKPLLNSKFYNYCEKFFSDIINKILNKIHI